MNIKEVHPASTEVGAKNVFKSDHTNVVALQILTGKTLAEHITRIPAMLVCVFGKVRFENEKDEVLELLPGDMLHIEPLVKHKVVGLEDSCLILVR